MLNGSLNITAAIPVWITYERSLTIWTILMIGFGLLSAAANILLILSIVFTRHGSRLSGSEILIVHLLFVELVVAGGIVPALAVTTAVPRFRLTTESCQIFYTVICWVVQVEHWSAFVLSLNRLTAIVFPHQHGTFCTRRAVLFIIIATWLSPFPVTLPQILGVAGRYGVVLPWQSCGLLPAKTATGRAIYLLLLTVASYLPMVGTFITYVAILGTMQIWKIRRSRHHEKPIRQLALEKTKRRFRRAKMLFASSLWFLSCYLPFTLTSVYFSSLFVAMPDMHLWMRLLYYTGLMGSPIVFLVLSRDYRTRLANLTKAIWNLSGLQKLRRVHISPSTDSVSATPRRPYATNSKQH